MDYYTALREVLVKLFNDILAIEATAIISDGNFVGLTEKEIHVIDAIGVDELKNMSAIAKELQVTVGTLTIAINALVKKGYVCRERSERDRRVVYIKLTTLGREVYQWHDLFHQNMVRSVLNNLDGEEIQVLVKALSYLKDFFYQSKKEKSKKKETNRSDEDMNV